MNMWKQRVVEKYLQRHSNGIWNRKICYSWDKARKSYAGKNIQLTDSHQIISSLEADEFYKYLGMEEKHDVNNNKVVKENVKKKNITDE